MISYLKGKLAYAGTDRIIVDVNGVGYKVGVPFSIITELPKIGEDVKILTHMHVKEDGISLFGFNSEMQLTLFELLLGVSGVGPKAALALLSVLPASTLLRAISSDDFVTLNRVPGVGNKTAQRIVLELRDKAAALSLIEHENQTVESEPNTFNDAIEALMGLGYNRNDSRKAVDSASREVDDKDDVKSVISRALRILTRS